MKYIILLLALGSISAMASNCKVYVDYELVFTGDNSSFYTDLTLKDVKNVYKNRLNRIGHTLVDDIAEADYNLKVERYTVQGTGLWRTSEDEITEMVISRSNNESIAKKIYFKDRWTKRNLERGTKSSKMQSSVHLEHNKSRFITKVLKKISC